MNKKRVQKTVDRSLLMSVCKSVPEQASSRAMISVHAAMVGVRGPIR
jgi:hypothetical protein